MVGVGSQKTTETANLVNWRMESLEIADLGLLEGTLVSTNNINQIRIYMGR